MSEVTNVGIEQSIQTNSAMIGGTAAALMLLWPEAIEASNVVRDTVQTVAAASFSFAAVGLLMKPVNVGRQLVSNVAAHGLSMLGVTAFISSIVQGGSPDAVAPVFAGLVGGGVLLWDYLSSHNVSTNRAERDER